MFHLTDVSSFSNNNQPDNSFFPLVTDEVGNLKKFENNLKFLYQADTSNSALESQELAKSLKHVDVMTGNQPIQKIKNIEFLCIFNEAVFNG